MAEMASFKPYLKIFSIYFANFLIGIALVSFPAAGNVLMSENYYKLSQTEYGVLFIPQAIGSILFSLLSAWFMQKNRIGLIYIVGLLFGCLSMGLFAFCHILIPGDNSPFVVLLLATALIGCATGFVVPSTNRLAISYFSKREGSALLILNACLGIGLTCSPLIYQVSVYFFSWWLFPVIIAAGFFVLLLISFPLGFEIINPGKIKEYTLKQLPKRYWLFALFAFAYGLVETANGNWATVFLVQEIGTPEYLATFSLSLFWAMSAMGRIFFAFYFKEKVYSVLPFLLTAAFILIANLPVGGMAAAVAAFALAGLGCSALLPLTVSIASEEMDKFKAYTTGLLYTVYYLGYGIVSFGIGNLVEYMKLSYSVIFLLFAAIAFFMGMLSFIILQKKQ